MVVLVSGIVKHVRADPRAGMLLVPAHRNHAAPRDGRPWACDNGCFKGLDVPRYRLMLARLAKGPRDGLLFVTAPDVLGDALATRQRFEEWEPELRAGGWPVAYVLQDGQRAGLVPWRRIAAVFVGGTTAFKLGPQAARLVAEARRRGKWAHMGRVNSARRLEWAARIGCQSVDGTTTNYSPSTRLPFMLDAADAVRAQQRLRLGDF